MSDTAQTQTIAALTAQLDEVQRQLAAVTANQQAAAPDAPAKPARAMPTVGELVTYTDTAATGLEHTRRAIAVAVDEENRKVLVNWLPDAEAELAVDDLDA